jgi:hypothetical protein
MNDPSPLLNPDGVQGLCVHAGAEICWKRLPPGISEDQAAALCAAVHGAFVSYAGAERTVTEACFAYQSRTVLIIARPPETAPATDFLTFLLRSPANAGEAAAAARLWLQNNPELRKPVPRPASPLMMSKK